MNQFRDVAVTLIAAVYHLSLFGIAAYLVYWKGASAWVFLIPLCLTISFKTKDD